MQTNTIKNIRKRLLANHIKCDIHAIKDSKYGKEYLYEYENSDYLILTNEEATEEAKQQINDFLWSLDASLIQKHLKTELSIGAIQHVQSDMCEKCTFLLLSLIEDTNAFYQEIISTFGRGYFIAFHDFKEHILFDFNENKRYYIYRLS